MICSSLNGFHRFIINSSDSTFNQFELTGIGLCISTVLGSSGYNYNNDGNVLPLDSNLWSITDIVCNRSVNDVIPEQNLEITLAKIKEKIRIYADGIDLGLTLTEGSQLLLKSGRKVELAFLNLSEFKSKRLASGRSYK